MVTTLAAMAKNLVTLSCSIEYFRLHFSSYSLKLLTMNRDFPPPNLDTMPINALREILSNLNIIERSVLRKVNRTLREAVDNNHTTVDVEFDFCDDYITLTLDGIMIEYSNDDENKCQILDYQKPKIVDSDYVEFAKKDFGIHLKNPNTRIKNLKLQWEYSEDLFYKLLHILETFFDEITQNGGSGFSVETLELGENGGNKIARLLRLIDVNTITSLIISCDQFPVEEEEEFINVPQWERIRDFRVFGNVEHPYTIINALGNVSSFSIDQLNNNVDLTSQMVLLFILLVSGTLNYLQSTNNFFSNFQSFWELQTWKNNFSRLKSSSSFSQRSTHFGKCGS
ncbi:hypothetical protein B9Z55_026134 [Caenorhabditis nigoni]|nr:hypothetical protein B9Z55_026134 [Caenorhabditis nigoni]